MTSNMAERVVGQGYDTVEWVRKVVLPRIERSPENGRYLFPDPLVDLQTYAQMHSWYKHYSNEPGRFYPILRIGPEKRGLIDLTKQRAPADASVPLHWRFCKNCW